MAGEVDKTSKFGALTLANWGLPNVLSPSSSDVGDQCKNPVIVWVCQTNCACEGPFPQ
jgi:hypothetical protein